MDADRADYKRCTEILGSLGRRLFRLIASFLSGSVSRSVLVWPVFLAALFVAPALGQLGPEPLEKEWFGFVEAGLGIGRMDHGVDGRHEELFGVEVLRGGGEQDAFGLRGGIGRGIGNGIDALLYCGVTALTPGLFFDNHGPFIPPELTFSMTEILLGLEARQGLLRTGVGCGFYSGTVDLHPDEREGYEPGEPWEGELGRTIGPHILIGFVGSDSGCVGDASLTFMWRYVPLSLPTTPTGAPPETFAKHMIELHFSVGLSGYLF